MGDFNRGTRESYLTQPSIPFTQGQPNKVDMPQTGFLADLFGIDYRAAKTDPERAARQQRMFNIAVAGVTGIGFMIPLLVLAMKLIAPLELRAYYSTGRQALAGNAEATLLRTVDRHYTEREGRRRSDGEDAS